MATAPNPYPISPFFSFRWVNENPVIDARYRTRPIDSLVDDGSYAQPWERTDKGQIQYINLYVPTCGLYTCDDVLFKAIDMIPMSPPIVDTDLVGYNAEIDFSDVQVGRYYAKLTYTDGDNVLQDWRTSPLDVEQTHPGTLLFEVSNKVNEKGSIFVNGDGSLIKINCRVHGMLRSPIPKSDTEDYEDQYDDLTQLSSIPSENWTNILGNSAGNVTNYFQIPWWVIQKFNLLYSLNKVLIDGQPFAKISGAEFKAFRVENQLNEDAYWAIDVQPNALYGNEQYQTGVDPSEGDYVLIYKAKSFNDVSADFNMAGIFTVDTNLIKVILYNNGLDAFTLKIGTTAGGNEIRQFNIPADQVKNVLDIEFPFNANSTVYFTGLAGTDCDLRVVWDDFKAVNTPPPTATRLWNFNTPYFWIDVPGGIAFGDAFTVATGKGNAGTDWEGCVLAGTNGTLDVVGAGIQVWDRTQPLERGQFIGTPGNQIELEIPQLPANHKLTIAKDRKGGNAGFDVLSAVSPPGPAGQNDYDIGGDGDPIIVQNYDIVLPCFFYVGV